MRLHDLKPRPGAKHRRKRLGQGESSGHVLKVREMRVDCDADALLVRVEAAGPGVCHEGYRSCFFRTLDGNGKLAVADKKVFEAESVYGKKESQ